MKKFLSSYTAKLIYIFIIAALLAATIFFGIKLHSINKQQQEEISAIRQALKQLEAYADNNDFNEDGKPYIHIELEQPKTNFESAESLTDVLNIVQNQNMQSSQDISNYITVFSIIISVVVLVIPIFNYKFLQKDQVEKLNKQYETFSERFEKEIERMEKTIEQSSEVTEALASPEEDSIEISPISTSTKDRARALYIQGRLSMGKKNFEQSISLLNEAIELEPNNARYYNIRGSALHSLKHYEEALKDANSAIKLKPDNARYYNNRGITFSNLERYEEALKDKHMAIALEPENAKYYNSRGATLNELRLYKEALKDKNKAIELEPENAKYYNSRGITLHNLKRLKEALNDVNKAIELHASDEFKCAKGMTLSRLKRYKKAIDIFNDINGYVEKSYYFRYRGLAKLGLAQSKGEPIPNEVWEDFDKAIELGSDDYKDYRMKAEAYLMIGEPKQAKPLLDKANELRPKEPNTHHLFALYYERIGNNDKAKEYHELADKYGYIPEPEIEEDDEKDCN